MLLKYIATPVLIKKPVDNNFNLTFDDFCKNRNKLADGDYLDGEYYSLVSGAVMSNKNVHPDILAKYPDLQNYIVTKHLSKSRLKQIDKLRFDFRLQYSLDDILQCYQGQHKRPIYRGKIANEQDIAFKTMIDEIPYFVGWHKNQVRVYLVHGLYHDCNDIYLPNDALTEIASYMLPIIISTAYSTSEVQDVI